tara:strand:+ start:160 stop:609 length:450 start_codon:yes stop_codon:yes gene_type:complete
VRHAVPEDNAPIQDMIFAVLAKFGVEAEPEGDGLDAMEFGLNEDRIYLVEVENSVPIGSAILTDQGEGLFKLSKLFLSIADRGKGVGRLLQKAAVKAAGDAGGTEVYLRTRDLYEAAIRLYERSDWTRGVEDIPPPGPPVKYSISTFRT